jgi:hypothetical protein
MSRVANNYEILLQRSLISLMLLSANHMKSTVRVNPRRTLVSVPNSSKKMTDLFLIFRVCPQSVQMRTEAR